MAATIKNWQDNFPPKVNAADVNGFKNENNTLIESSGAALDVGDNTQTTKAVATYAGAASFYVDGGVANQYALSPAGGRLTPFEYVLGLQINFVPANTNTSSSTINIGALGVRDIKLPSGAETTAGSIRSGEYISAYYDGTNFNIIGRYEEVSSGPTGIIEFGYFTAAEPGWILYRDGSIGNAESGATLLASDQTVKLYVQMYNTVSDQWAPVSGGRTGDAGNDFNANKTLTLPPLPGRVIGVAGSGSGLSVRDVGAILGEEKHLQTINELVSHAHPLVGLSGQVSANFYQLGNNGNTVRAQSVSDTENTGGSTPFNIMQPTTFLNAKIKL